MTAFELNLELWTVWESERACKQSTYCQHLSMGLHTISREQPCVPWQPA